MSKDLNQYKEHEELVKAIMDASKHDKKLIYEIVKAVLVEDTMDKIKSEPEYKNLGKTEEEIREIVVKEIEKRMKEAKEKYSRLIHQLYER